MLAPLLKPWPPRRPSALASDGRLTSSWAPATWLGHEAPAAAAFAEDWNARAMETQLPALVASARAARAEAAHDEYLVELPALRALMAFRP